MQGRLLEPRGANVWEVSRHGPGSPPSPRFFFPCDRTKPAGDKKSKRACIGSCTPRNGRKQLLQARLGNSKHSSVPGLGTPWRVFQTDAPIHSSRQKRGSPFDFAMLGSGEEAANLEHGVPAEVDPTVQSSPRLEMLLGKCAQRCTMGLSMHNSKKKG